MRQAAFHLLILILASCLLLAAFSQPVSHAVKSTQGSDPQHNSSRDHLAVQHDGPTPSTSKKALSAALSHSIHDGSTADHISPLPPAPILVNGKLVQVPHRKLKRRKKQVLADPLETLSEPLTQRIDESNQHFQNRLNNRESTIKVWTERRNRVLGGLPQEQHEEIWQRYLRQLQDKNNISTRFSRARKRERKLEAALSSGTIVEKHVEKTEAQLALQQRRRLHYQRKMIRKELRLDPNNENLQQLAIDLGLDPITLLVANVERNDLSEASTSSNRSKLELPFDLNEVYVPGPDSPFDEANLLPSSSEGRIG